MKIPLFCMLIATSYITASEYPRVIYRDKNCEDSLTTYKAIVAFSEKPQDHYQCILSFDAITNKYSGARFNNGSTRSEWYSMGIDEDKAKKYYENLVAQGK